MKNKNKNLHIRVTEKEFNQYRHLADSKDMKLSQLIRELLDKEMLK